VSLVWLAGLTSGMMNLRLKRTAGMSLIELLCVITILAILAALYFPAIIKAYHRIRTFIGGLS
jgi:prepilin-type N-terminal cleavage/methylation domain-containing protein